LFYWGPVSAGPFFDFVLLSPSNISPFQKCPLVFQKCFSRAANLGSVNPKPTPFTSPGVCLSSVAVRKIPEINNVTGEKTDFA
jgi:hypothetical protein